MTARRPCWAGLAVADSGALYAAWRVGLEGGNHVDNGFYDSLETREPAEREAAWRAALRKFGAAEKQHPPGYRDRAAERRGEDIVDRRALVDLRVIRKSELVELQRGDPPFGGFNAVPLGKVGRIFASPGPI